MKHFSYYIIGGEILLISLLICSIICLYYQSQTINKQRESIKELISKYYKFEEYKEAIKLADIIFDVLIGAFSLLYATIIASNSCFDNCTFIILLFYTIS